MNSLYKNKWGFKAIRRLFLRVNPGGHHNMELIMWRHVDGRHEQHEHHYNRKWSQVFRKDKQFVLHLWYPSCNSDCKPGDTMYVVNEERTVITTNGTYPCPFVTHIPIHRAASRVPMCWIEDALSMGNDMSYM